jgi:hypothetical protein
MECPLKRGPKKRYREKVEFASVFSMEDQREKERAPIRRDEGSDQVRMKLPPLCDEEHTCGFRETFE